MAHKSKTMASLKNPITAEYREFVDGKWNVISKETFDPFDEKQTPMRSDYITIGVNGILTEYKVLSCQEDSNTPNYFIVELKNLEDDAKEKSFKSINEIALGDYVMFNEITYRNLQSCGVPKIVRICGLYVDSLGNEFVTIKYKGCDGIEYTKTEYEANQFMPIALTREHLISNGFRYQHAEDKFKRDRDMKDVEIKWNKKSEYWSVVNTGIELHYVHDLQHLFRMYKLYDLANNFNIAKYSDFDIAKLADPKVDVVTRSGQKARVVCADKSGCSPIVALVDFNGVEKVYTYGADGRESNSDYNRDLFIIEQ